MIHHHLASLSFAVVVLLVAGCSGAGASRSAEPNEDSVPVRSLPEDVSDAKAELVSQINRWLGTAYRYGGTDASGFDCSGFVRRVMRDAFDESLPRTTRAQMRVGSEVKRTDLRTADLVFFRTPARSDHVGVYLGDGEFAHASSSSGVMISHLSESYWSKSYRTARRLFHLEDISDSDQSSETHAAPSSAARLATAPPTSGRVGW
ncbi:MAG: hydrolase Nlp/P60 [Rhodothermales bacterium]|nr:hydrolase Nlp/P60 [Rhodothermales bacterium]